MLRSKFRVKAGFAGLVKETEDAAFVDNDSSSEKAKMGAAWRFGDVLSFPLRLRDLADGGLVLQLRAQTGVRLGVWQVDLPQNTQDLGEVVVDLRRRILPACVQARSPPPPQQCSSGGAAAGRPPPPGGPDDWQPTQAALGEEECEVECPPSWESPAFALPLTRISRSPHAGVKVEIVARVVVSFSLNSCPRTLLWEVEERERPLSDKLAARVAMCFTTPSAPLAVCGSGSGGCVTAVRAHRGGQPSRCSLEEPEAEADLPPCTVRL